VLLPSPVSDLGLPTFASYIAGITVVCHYTQSVPPFLLSSAPSPFSTFRAQIYILSEVGYLINRKIDVAIKFMEY
jgi:hypothetical protein